MLEFLEDTIVGKMPGLALFGVEEEESDLEEITLWADEDEGSGEESRESGLAHPRLYFSFVSFLCFIHVSSGDEG